MDIKNMTNEKLKALAYDELQRIDRAQGNIRVLNAELAYREKNPKTDKPEEK